MNFGLHCCMLLVVRAVNLVELASPTPRTTNARDDSYDDRLRARLRRGRLALSVKKSEAVGSSATRGQSPPEAAVAGDEVGG
jgi:hypothetical protein